MQGPSRQENKWLPCMLITPPMLRLPFFRQLEKEAITWGLNWATAWTPDSLSYSHTLGPLPHECRCARKCKALISSTCLLGSRRAAEHSGPPPYVLLMLSLWNGLYMRGWRLLVGSWAGEWFGVCAKKRPHEGKRGECVVFAWCGKQYICTI